MRCVIDNSEMNHVVMDIYSCPVCGLMSSNLPVDESKYGQGYLEKYIEYSDTPLGKRINETRWDVVQDVLNFGSVLDYGCGAGHFIRMAPEGFIASGYDINPYSEFKANPAKRYDAVTFWDSLEHMADPWGVLKSLDTDIVFATVPNTSRLDFPINQWIHYRPFEHIHHFSEKSIRALFESAGFKRSIITYAEGSLRNQKHPRWLLTISAWRGNGED